MTARKAIESRLKKLNHSPIGESRKDKMTSKNTYSSDSQKGKYKTELDSYGNEVDVKVEK